MVHPPLSFVARAALVAVALGSAGSAPLRAENLLINPEFDSGLQPWKVDFPQVHFAGPDAGFAPDSGSMQIDLAVGDPEGAAFTGRQCVPVAAGAGFDASAYAALLGPDHPHARVFLELAWYADPACAGAPLATDLLAEADDRYQFWLVLTGPAVAPAGAAAVSFRLGLEKLEAGGDFAVSALFDHALLDDQPGDLGGSGPCLPDARTLCLGAGRFRVTASWEGGANSSGAGYAATLTADTGYFWFFDPANVETVVKVLDGCGVNQHFWVYAGGLTDLGVTLTVVDTQSGATAIYRNAAGAPFRTVADVEALAGCP